MLNVEAVSAYASNWEVMFDFYCKSVSWAGNFVNLSELSNIALFGKELRSVLYYELPQNNYYHYTCFQNKNMNMIVGDEYGPNTKLAMSRLSEKEISFEIIEVPSRFILCPLCKRFLRQLTLFLYSSVSFNFWSVGASS